MARSVIIDIEVVIDMIIDNYTFREIATELGVKLSTLHDFISKPEHSARTKQALIVSADGYADKAEEVLIEAKGSLVEIQRARELAQHYRWKAAKRYPKGYGDKVELDASEGLAKVFKIGYSKPNED